MKNLCEKAFSLMDNYKFIYVTFSICLFIFVTLLVLTSCTYSVSLVNTHGQASDIIDDNDTPSITATVPVTGAPLPSLSIRPMPQA